ncbi:mechanosensitive ion channel [Acuticoccus sp. MNP-M23]|uniref:mechanosensitive ion channel family protein n=1 Tax=Acuticoccus sp. MNP-M23 TaxID=3072793 RepID=UPI0028167BA9|nr:mechanosensitive ion channel domain-containing protein [Acuticoccus sp. MNP-M23]WMS42069.1 mechanosensitive ion channel [Acuticoccus sp. MNP-M23]
MRWTRILAALVASVCLWGGGALAQGSGPDVFKVDALNAGLPAPPQGLDRTTPQSTLEAFLRANGRTDYRTAAYLLDLADIPDAEQAARGPELARKLGLVIERKIPLDLAAIPDRPDGMETMGTSREPMVGEPRKSISLGQLDLERWPVSVRINRVQAGDDASPVWVFSRQSVEHIDALFKRYGPTPLEKAMPGALRTDAFWGLMWWEVIAIPLIFAATVLIGYIFYRLFGIVERRVPFGPVEDVVRLLKLPIILIILAAFVQVVVMKTFVFSAGADTSVSTVFWLLILVALVVGVSRVMDAIIDNTSDRYLERIDKPENTRARMWYTNLSAAKRIGIIIVLVVGVAIAFSSLRLFSSFGLSLLVSAGVATAVLGLAAQTVLGNIFASLQLAIAQPIRIGDSVLYDGQWAHVEKINYTFVQLRTWDQKRFIVPVKNFISNAFENWTMEEPEMIKPVELKLDHRVDVEFLRREFRKMAEEDEDFVDHADPKVQVISQDEDGIMLRFYCTAADPSTAWDLHCRIRERLMAVVRTLDEPSGLPRTRIAYVSNTVDSDAAGPRTDTGKPNPDTGEPGEKTVEQAAQ